ncbi:MAG: cyclase family protein, partial [Anaerolineae bacterium]|nr:cyclase family protein [Anaerolineae bacterium]
MTSKFIDLSQTFEDGMPGFKLKNEDGSFTQYTAHIYPFITHEQSKPKYEGLAEFEITEMRFQ